MSLDDRQHVEAVAIIRRLRESPDPAALLAADHWLRENHPAPEVYIAALKASASADEETA